MGEKPFLTTLKKKWFPFSILILLIIFSLIQYFISGEDFDFIEIIKEFLRYVNINEDVSG